MQNCLFPGYFQRYLSLDCFGMLAISRLFNARQLKGKTFWQLYRSDFASKCQVALTRAFTIALFFTDVDNLSISMPSQLSSNTKQKCSCFKESERTGKKVNNRFMTLRVRKMCAGRVKIDLLVYSLTLQCY